jgi:uncharacterized protein (TIGR03437 family)
VAAAMIRRSGSSQEEPVAAKDSEQGQYAAIPIDLGFGSERVILALFGTGIRFRTSLTSVLVTIGGVYAQVISAEPHPNAVGVDQVEVVVPRTLAGRGEVEVLLTVDGQIANPVFINIK